MADLKKVYAVPDEQTALTNLAMIDITKKWTGHRQDRGPSHSQPEICFEERLGGHN